MYASMVLRDGIEVEINKQQYETMVPKIRMSANVKMYRTPEGHYVVLSPSNLLMIKFYGEDTEGEEKAPKKDLGGKPHPKAEKPAGAKKKEEMSAEELAIIAEVEGKLPETEAEVEDKEPKKDPLADMIEKSNCKHEPEKLVLFSQHTAKGMRYFPVCSFCGKRERYVSEKKIAENQYEGTPNEKWTVEDVNNALEYVA
jgi:hypothetical protein